MHHNFTEALKVLFAAALTVFTLTFSAALGWNIYNSFFRLPETVVVPSIESQSYENAVKILKNFNLSLKVKKREYRSNIPAGQIIEQNPEAGQLVKSNREIQVWESMGGEIIAVPDLRGLSVREAELELGKRRLLLGKVKIASEKPEAPEQITEQTPSPGDRVKRGAPVDIKINKGYITKYAVPAWEGQQLSSVAEQMKETPFTLGRVRWIYDDFIPRGQVLRQNPQPGQYSSKDLPVNLDISAGNLMGELFMKQETIRFMVPESLGRVEVVFHLRDFRGNNMCYRASHEPGDRIDYMVSSWGSGELLIFIDGKLQKKEVI